MGLGCVAEIVRFPPNVSPLREVLRPPPPLLDTVTEHECANLKY